MADDDSEIITIESRPMPFGECGSWHERVWDVIRTHLGRGTTASAPRHGRTWGGVRYQLRFLCRPLLSLKLVLKISLDCFPLHGFINNSTAIRGVYAHLIAVLVLLSFLLWNQRLFGVFSLLRCLVNQIHELVELRRDDYLRSAVALLANGRIIGGHRIVFSASGSCETFGVYTITCLKRLHDRRGAER